MNNIFKKIIKSNRSVEEEEKILLGDDPVRAILEQQKTVEDKTEESPFNMEEILSKMSSLADRKPGQIKNHLILSQNDPLIALIREIPKKEPIREPPKTDPKSMSMSLDDTQEDDGIRGSPGPEQAEKSNEKGRQTSMSAYAEVQEAENKEEENPRVLSMKNDKILPLTVAGGDRKEEVPMTPAIHSNPAAQNTIESQKPLLKPEVKKTGGKAATGDLLDIFREEIKEDKGPISSDLENIDAQFLLQEAKEIALVINNLAARYQNKGS